MDENARQTSPTHLVHGGLEHASLEHASLEHASLGHASLEHGGDPAEAEALYGRPQGGWIDLSTGINPHSYPIGDLAPECWSRLPDSRMYDRLRQAAVTCYGVPNPALVVPAPGTQALIQWLPRLFGARTRVTVLGPTYNEHAHGWSLAGHEVTEASGLDAIDPLADVVVAVNPNNPDGRRLEADALMGLAAELAARGGWLVVDEAFSDVSPELSLAAKAGTPGLVVLRSFGKFFGLAGLRLGFALCGADLAGRLTRALGPWTVSGPAVEVAAAALADEPWIGAMRKRLKVEAARLDGLLKDNELKVIGGTDLFRLSQSAQAREVHARLARNGILVRRFSQQVHWLRFGLPGDENSWKRLEDALSP